MAWNDRTSSLMAELRAFINGRTDQHTRTMVAAWVRAWDVLAPDLEAALNELILGAVDERVRRSDVIRSVKLQKSLEAIQASLAGLVDESAADVIRQLEDIVAHTGSVQERLIKSQLPKSEREIVTAWSRVDKGQLAAIVERTSEQITKLSFPISDEATAAIRRELVRGVAVGSNPREVARRMISRTNGRFNGGLTRALTIARTEMLTAHREAAALQDEQNTDVLAGWVWIASFSARTCSACWGMSGQQFPPSVPGPDGHQNCRCSRGPVTKTWAELGFAGIDEPPSLLPDAAARFDALPVGEQRSILGPTRYSAWKAGDYPMSDWATKRENSGWRDSYVRSKAPAA